MTTDDVFDGIDLTDDDPISGRTDHIGLSTPERVLTIGAHPDDAEFGAGASLARWVSEGARVTMLIMTDGSKGAWDPTTDPPALADTRRAEQKAAAAILGAEEVIHLDRVDGELEYTMDLRTEVALQIRRVRPNVVLSHDPWQRYQMHPDHRATGLAAMDGVISAREPMALTESGLAAHRPDAILLWSADEPDHAEPVNERWFGVKLSALLCHATQARTSMGNAHSDADARRQFEEMLTEWHRTNGQRLGTGPSEIFKRLTP